jgi:tetratricopeptide (TPR) repeat protein
MPGQSGKYQFNCRPKALVYFYRTMRLRFLLFCLASVPVLVASAQNNKVDSLRTLLSKGDRDYEIIFGLAYELFDVNNQEALLFAVEANNIAKDVGDSSKIVTSGRITGQLLRRNDKLNESIAILLEVLPIAHRNKFIKDEKSILNALAIGYTFLADYDKALDVHFQALQIREREGDKKEISYSLNNIGLVYFKLKNYKLALDYYNRSLALRREVGDNYDMERLFINIGLCYNQLFKYEQAEEYIRQGLAFCDDQCQDQIKIEAEFGLGTSNFGLQNLDEALKHFSLSLKISDQQQNRRFQAENLLNISKIFLAKNETDSAIVALKRTEELTTLAGYN